MKLPELLADYRRRREDAERHGSTAAVAQIYTVVIEDLEELELVLPQKMLKSAEVGDMLSLAQRTVANKCQRGEFPGAEKTSGKHGEWRIPAAEVYRKQHEPKVRRPGRRILDDDF